MSSLIETSKINSSHLGRSISYKINGMPLRGNIFSFKNIIFYSASVLMCLLFLGVSGCQHTNQNKGDNIMNKRIINPWTWQDQFGFVQANEITGGQRMLFTAGIVSVDGEGNLLHEGDMEKQINQIIKNMETILEQSNFKLSDVVTFTYYTTDIQAFVEASPLLIAHLNKANCKPATSLIGVNSLFHPDCVVEITATLVD